MSEKLFSNKYDWVLNKKQGPECYPKPCSHENAFSLLMK